MNKNSKRVISNISLLCDLNYKQKFKRYRKEFEYNMSQFPQNSTRRKESGIVDQRQFLESIGETSGFTPKHSQNQIQNSHQVRSHNSPSTHTVVAQNQSALSQSMLNQQQSRDNKQSIGELKLVQALQSKKQSVAQKNDQDQMNGAVMSGVGSPKSVKRPILSIRGSKRGTNGDAISNQMQNQKHNSALNVVNSMTLGSSPRNQNSPNHPNDNSNFQNQQSGGYPHQNQQPSWVVQQNSKNSRISPQNNRLGHQYQHLQVNTQIGGVNIGNSAGAGTGTGAVQECISSKNFQAFQNNAQNALNFSSYHIQQQHNQHQLVGGGGFGDNSSVAIWSSNYGGESPDAIKTAQLRHKMSNEHIQGSVGDLQGDQYDNDVLSPLLNHQDTLLQEDDRQNLLKDYAISPLKNAQKALKGANLNNVTKNVTSTTSAASNAAANQVVQQADMKSEKGEGGTIYEKSEEGRVSPRSTTFNNNQQSNVQPNIKNDKNLPMSTPSAYKINKMPHPNQTGIKRIEVESKAGPTMVTKIIKNGQYLSNRHQQDQTNGVGMGSYYLGQGKGLQTMENSTNKTNLQRLGDHDQNTPNDEEDYEDQHTMDDIISQDSQQLSQGSHSITEDQPEETLHLVLELPPQQNDTTSAFLSLNQQASTIVSPLPLKKITRRVTNGVPTTGQQNVSKQKMVGQNKSPCDSFQQAQIRSIIAADQRYTEAHKQKHAQLNVVPSEHFKLNVKHQYQIQNQNQNQHYGDNKRQHYANSFEMRNGSNSRNFDFEAENSQQFQFASKASDPLYSTNQSKISGASFLKQKSTFQRNKEIQQQLSQDAGTLEHQYSGVSRSTSGKSTKNNNNNANLEFVPSPVITANVKQKMSPIQTNPSGLIAIQGHETLRQQKMRNQVLTMRQEDSRDFSKIFLEKGSSKANTLTNTGRRLAEDIFSQNESQNGDFKDLLSKNQKHKNKLMLNQSSAQAFKLYQTKNMTQKSTFNLNLNQSREYQRSKNGHEDGSQLRRKNKYQRSGSNLKIQIQHQKSPSPTHKSNVGISSQQGHQKPTDPSTVNLASTPRIDQTKQVVDSHLKKRNHSIQARKNVQSHDLQQERSFISLNFVYDEIKAKLQDQLLDEQRQNQQNNGLEGNLTLRKDDSKDSQISFDPTKDMSSLFGIDKLNFSNQQQPYYFVQPRSTRQTDNNFHPHLQTNQSLYRYQQIKGKPNKKDKASGRKSNPKTRLNPLKNTFEKPKLSLQSPQENSLQSTMSNFVMTQQSLWPLISSPLNSTQLNQKQSFNQTVSIENEMLPSLKKQAGRNRTVFGVNSGEFIEDSETNFPHEKETRCDKRQLERQQNHRIMQRTSKSFRVSQHKLSTSRIKHGSMVNTNQDLLNQSKNSKRAQQLLNNTGQSKNKDGHAKRSQLLKKITLENRKESQEKFVLETDHENPVDSAGAPPLMMQVISQEKVKQDYFRKIKLLKNKRMSNKGTQSPIFSKNSVRTKKYSVPLTKMPLNQNSQADLLLNQLDGETNLITINDENAKDQQTDTFSAGGRTSSQGFKSRQGGGIGIGSQDGVNSQRSYSRASLNNAGVCSGDRHDRDRHIQDHLVRTPHQQVKNAMKTSTNFKHHDTLIKKDHQIDNDEIDNEKFGWKDNQTPSVRFQQTLQQPVAKIRQFVSRKSKELEDEQDESELSRSKEFKNNDIINNTSTSPPLDKEDAKAQTGLGKESSNAINLNKTQTTFRKEDRHEKRDQLSKDTHKKNDKLFGNLNGQFLKNQENGTKNGNLNRRRAAYATQNNASKYQLALADHNHQTSSQNLQYKEMFIKLPSKKNLQRVVMKVKGGRLPKSTTESFSLQMNSTALPLTSLNSGQPLDSNVLASEQTSHLEAQNKPSSQSSQKRLGLFGNQMGNSYQVQQTGGSDQFQFELFGSPKATVDVLTRSPSGKNPKNVVISPPTRHHQTTKEQRELEQGLKIISDMSQFIQKEGGKIDMQLSVEMNSQLQNNQSVQKQQIKSVSRANLNPPPILGLESQGTTLNAVQTVTAGGETSENLSRQSFTNKLVDSKDDDAQSTFDLNSVQKVGEGHQNLVEKDSLINKNKINQDGIGTVVSVVQQHHQRRSRPISDYENAMGRGDDGEDIQTRMQQDGTPRESAVAIRSDDYQETVDLHHISNHQNQSVQGGQSSLERQKIFSAQDKNSVFIGTKTNEQKEFLQVTSVKNVEKEQVLVQILGQSDALGKNQQDQSDGNQPKTKRDYLEKYKANIVSDLKRQKQEFKELRAQKLKDLQDQIALKKSNKKRNQGAMTEKQANQENKLLKFNNNVPQKLQNSDLLPIFENSTETQQQNIHQNQQKKLILDTSTQSRQQDFASIQTKETLLLVTQESKQSPSQINLPQQKLAGQQHKQSFKNSYEGLSPRKSIHHVIQTQKSFGFPCESPLSPQTAGIGNWQSRLKKESEPRISALGTFHDKSPSKKPKTKHFERIKKKVLDDGEIQTRQEKEQKFIVEGRQSPAPQQIENQEQQLLAASSSTESLKTALVSGKGKRVNPRESFEAAYMPKDKRKSIKGVPQMITHSPKDQNNDDIKAILKPNQNQTQQKGSPPMQT